MSKDRIQVKSVPRIDYEIKPNDLSPDVGNSRSILDLRPVNQDTASFALVPEAEQALLNSSSTHTDLPQDSLESSPDNNFMPQGSFRLIISNQAQTMPNVDLPMIPASVLGDNVHYAYDHQIQHNNTIIPPHAQGLIEASLAGDGSASSFVNPHSYQ